MTQGDPVRDVTAARAAWKRSKEVIRDPGFKAQKGVEY